MDNKHEVNVNLTRSGGTYLSPTQKPEARESQIQGHQDIDGESLPQKKKKKTEKKTHLSDLYNP